MVVLVYDLWDLFPAVVGCDPVILSQKPEFFPASFYSVLIIFLNYV